MSLELDKVTPFLTAGIGEKLSPNTVHILGFPFDGTTSYRAGARQGPTSLREASSNLELYSPYLKRELSEVEIIDLGNLPFYPGNFGMMNQAFKDLCQGFSFKENHSHLITLGGEHSISYEPIVKHLSEYEDLLLIHLDAHADLRDGFLGNHFSHASIIRRVLDHFKKGHSLKQYGIRSGTKEEFEYMEAENTLSTSLDDFLSFLTRVPKERPIYLTLDLDFFDPAFVPGTGTPEAGGASFHDFIKILKVLKSKNFIGADIVELAPNLDHSGISNCLAAKTTREIILSLATVNRPHS